MEIKSKNPWISFIPHEEKKEKEKNNEEIYAKPKAFVDKDEIEERANRIIENDSDSDDDDIIINEKSKIFEEEDDEVEEEVVTVAVVEVIEEEKGNKEIDIKKVLIADEEENNIEEGESHRLTLSEAFADDDVVAEFRLEKVCFKYFYGIEVLKFLF